MSSQAELRKVTFRKNGGKAHRGVVFEDGMLVCSCRCPGSTNGSLTKRAQIIAEGWEKSNCTRNAE